MVQSALLASRQLIVTCRLAAFDPCQCFAELASKCDIVFCSMAADSALESVFSSYLSGKPKRGSLFIDCSTVFPDLTSKLAGEAKKAGISYLSCPVFGRPDAALAGKTLVVASGEAAAKKKVSLP